MAEVSLDIILPCYNPPKGWASNVPKAVAHLQEVIGTKVLVNVILVNDGSKTGVSNEDIDFLRAQLPHFEYLPSHPNQGKGHALRLGASKAHSDIQIYTDIDFPYTSESFAAIFKALASGTHDIVAGIRNAEYYAHVPAARKAISKILRWLLRTFLRLKIADTQCGLKGFNANGKAIFLQTRIRRFLFDLEFIFLASNEKQIRLTSEIVQLKPGVEFSKARVGILLRESLNFGSIFFRAILRRMRNEK
jgi:glycosyltransferase involved in cell wall biosynthesis